MTDLTSDLRPTMPILGTNGFRETTENYRDGPKSCTKPFSSA